MMQDAVISFEIFPPRNPEREAQLWKAVLELGSWSPRFVSVTQGAGGASSDIAEARLQTRRIVMRILKETALTPAAHITCAGASRAALLEAVRFYEEAGVRRLVVLRGDMPGMASYKPHEKGFASTPEFIKAIRTIGDFDISVSAYPEKHPDSASIEEGIDLLKRKIEAGATRAITQFVFETDHHLRYLDAVREAGITIPIVPGIIPTTNFEGILRMSQKCGATIPSWLRTIHEGLEDSPLARRAAAVQVASAQCRALYAHGVRQFHFYSLNQAQTLRALCREMGLARDSETKIFKETSCL